MKLRITAETYIPPEKRLYVDMDGVLVDFDSGVNRLNTKTLSHHKELLCGDFLIDDWDKHGTSGFQGEWIQFGSRQFPDWDAVEKYLDGKNV